MRTLRQRLTRSRINVARFEQKKATELIKSGASSIEIRRQVAISHRATQNMNK